MSLAAYVRSDSYRSKGGLKKTLRVMKLIALLLFAACLQVSASGYGQTITLTEKNVSLEKLFREIKKQTGFTFWYEDQLLRNTKRVDIDVKNASIETVLAICLKDQLLQYEIIEKTIVIKQKPAATSQPSAPKENPPPPISIRGRITNDNGEPVRVTVTVKGTNNATSTNDNGEYELNNVDEKATIVISGVSIEPVEMKVNGRIFLNISVKNKISEGEEVVVAYGKQSQQSLTGAVTVVKGEQIQTLPNKSFDKSLQGLVPGLQITLGNGQPGGGVGVFQLRGIATGADPSQGGTYSRHPLIVMDGVPVIQEPFANVSSIQAPNTNPLAQLNPSDIESISVLKDASAIALYGARASNGVIIVTTKKGKQGKVQITYRNQTDISTRLKDNVNMLNQQQYLELLYETYRNSNPGYFTDDVILADLKTKFPSRPDGSWYPETDWLNELYDNTAITSVNELSVSGGSGRHTFYFNAEYNKQDGIDKRSGYDRTSMRFNYETRPNDWTRLSLNTSNSYNVQNNGSDYGETAASRMSPLNPTRKENGDYFYNFQWGSATPTDINTIGSYFPNPAAEQELNLNRITTYRSLSQLTGEIRFLKNFSFSTNLGIDFMVSESKRRVHPKLSEGYGLTVNSGNIYGGTFRVANLISSNQLRFNKKWREHSISLLAGHEAQVKTNNTIGVTLLNIASNPLTEELQSGTTINNASGNSNKETYLSYFGQLSYAFRNTYFLSGSIRMDGSSIYGENNQFGSHWSAGFGWVASSERFMKTTNRWLNYLKIRGSIGSAGNSAGISNTLRLTRLALLNLPTGTALVVDAAVTPNPSIKWEKTYSINLGVETRLFKEKLSITTDIYKRRTNDLLGVVGLAPATGFTQLRTNLGVLVNTGVEISASLQLIKTKDFRWNLSVNWSTNRNRLIKSAYPLENSSGLSPQLVSSNSITVNAPGRNYNSFYLVRWAGVDPATGRPLWIDSTGKPSNNWAAAKPEFVGKPQPDGFGFVSQTFSWKSLSLVLGINYQYGFQLYADPVNNKLTNDGRDPFINQSENALDRWQKPGDISRNPRRLLFGNFGGVADNGDQNSTRYILDGDFIRLSSIQLQFSVPAKWFGRLPVSGIRVFVQGSNIATWTKYSGRQDPESASALGRVSSIYPLAKAYSFGITINL